MRSVQVRKKYALQAEYKEHGQLGKYQKVTVSGQKIARRRGRERRWRNTGLGFCWEEEEKPISSTSGTGALKCDGTSVDVRG